jgi:hypothetical protein
MNPIIAVLAVALALSGVAGSLAGCSEKGQRLSPEPGQGYNDQGESARSNY